MISWYSVTSAEYKAASASEKTDDKIFYLTDTQQIYRGTKNYTENVVMYTTIPTSPATGKLYINSSTKECRVWDGTKWNIIGINVENSLTSDSTTSALAAAQGKILSEMCNSILTNTNQISKGNGFLAGGAQTSSGGIAIGIDADTVDEGIAIGEYSSSGKGVSIGKESYSSGQAGLALGNTARAEANNSIQIGVGSNNEEDTFQVGNYQLLNAGGYIPKDRIANKSITSDKIADNTFVSVEEGKSLIDENVASNLSYDDTNSTIKSLKPVKVSSTTTGVATTEKTTKVDGSGVTVTSVSKMGSNIMSSTNAVYSDNSIAFNDSNNKDIISIDADRRQIKIVRSDGAQNTTVSGGAINTPILNNATIGDLSEVVATDTTLVSIIKGLQEQVTSLGTTVEELQARLKTKSLLYVSNGRSDVPSTYEQLSYLESTGTQYIDTGLKTNSIFGCDIKYQSTGKANSPFGLDGVFGCNGSKTSTGTNVDLKLWFSYGQYGTRMNAMLRNSNGKSYINPIDSFDEYYATIHHFQWKPDGSVWYNEENVHQLDGPYSTVENYNIFAFAVNQGTTPSNKFYSKTRMYYLKFCAQDGTLLRDFVPCKRISDGVLGMYDVVSDTFFTNKGTGTFLYESL